MVKVFGWIGKHPWLTVLALVLVACVAFGPGTVGAWIGAHARFVVLGAWRFGVALLQGAF